MTTLDTTPSSPPVGLGSGAPAGAREGKLSTLPVTPWTPGSSLEAAPGDERGAGASSQPVEGPVTSEGTAPPALDPLMAIPAAAFRDDQDWAFDLYEMYARGGEAEALVYFVIEGDPWSKSRPRFTKRGATYQPRDDRDAERRLRNRLIAGNPHKFTGNVMLACRFYRSNFQRIDADNLLKHICDSANGILWDDDSQVTFVMAEVHHDAEQPRTVIMAGNHASTMLRGADRLKPCKLCGEPFLPPYKPTRRSEQGFCSNRCAMTFLNTDLSVEVACEQCAEPFRRYTTAQRFCSVGCARAASKGRPRPTKAHSYCMECGVELGHRRGGRCRPCWRANPRWDAGEQLQLDGTGARIEIRQVPRG